jgi:hypothetical protein
MAKPDFGGARGSSAGDDFHEWWALRHALPLLSDSNDLVVLTVEGLIADDEFGTSSDAWLGVDCTQYFGGDQLATATKVVVVDSADKLSHISGSILSHLVKDVFGYSIVDKSTLFAVS